MFSQQKIIPTPAALTNVNLYPSGVEMHHKVTCNLPAGIHELLISNLSNQIKENSIQMIPNDQIAILSISPISIKKVKNINDSNFEKLKKKKSDLEHVQNQLLSLKGAQTILDANRNVNGEHTHLMVAELAKVIDYYETKTLQLQTKIDELTNQEEVLEEEIGTIQKQEDVYEKQIRIQVQCNKPINTQLLFSYFSESATWRPVYDIKSKGVESALLLAYKAEIYQSTGLDWKNVSMSLSTANPSIGGNIPVLAPWFLKAQEASSSKFKNMQEVTTADFAALQGGVYQRKAGDRDQNFENGIKGFNQQYLANGNESAVNTKFQIEELSTIPSNTQVATNIVIKEFQLPVQYKYYCVPKKDQDAFFTAQLSNWESLSLMAGEANIFFDGNVSGKSYIDPSSTRDTLTISLGRDKKIVVKREKLTDFCTHKVIGSKNSQMITYEIRVRNTRKETVDIVLEDQYPLSTDKDIEVEVADISGASKDDQSGILTWKLKIQPNETKKLKVSYTIKYPKDQLLGPLF